MLNVTIDEYKNALPAERLNFYDIVLSQGKAIGATFDYASLSQAKNSFTLSSEGQTIAADEYLNLTSAQPVNIQTQIEGNGYVANGGEYYHGDAVSLVASPIEGNVFIGWYEDNDCVSSELIYSFTANESRTLSASFVVCAEPIYDDDDTYALTVTNGTGSGNFAASTAVTITANTAPTGQRFKQWDISPVVTFTNGTSATSATAKFNMPASAVTATAVYEDIPVTTYTVTYNAKHSNQKQANPRSGLTLRGFSYHQK